MPILKKGKDGQEVGSYRPISLTSQLGKLMERTIANRLTWWLEDKAAISPYQAGFRAGRSTTDQCLRLSQHISDGFQAKPPRRTLLTLFDYSRAFDTVRRSALLLKMIEKEVPLAFVRWVRAWFANRTARVRVEDTLSRSRVFREGVPQGSVLSPLLFITFIDDLLGRFDEATLVSAYADDLALAVSSSVKEETVGRMQEEVAVVERWSEANGLQLNVGKCEVCLFTPSTSEYKWKPDISIMGRPVKDTQNPRFLGVTYDKMLTFGAHVQETTAKMGARMNLLSAVGGADWGWSRESMAQIYTATQRSLAEYACPSWAPWISATNLEKLETQQRKAARRISGAVRSTPVEAVLREAGLEGLRPRYRRAAVCTYDKWRHMGLEDVRRTTADGDVVQRTKKKDWRGQCRLIHETLVTEGERPERNSNAAPPWRVGVPGGVMLARMSKTATAEEQRGAALEALERVGPVDRCVYTDGAAEGGISNGGAGVAVYDREGTCLRGWSCAAGRSCSSYSAEMVAMDEAVRWLGESREWQSAAVATDSRSLIDALQGSGQADGLGALRERLWRLHDGGRRLTLVWVPGHCQLPGNEEADRLAGQGCGMDQEEVALTGSTRLAVIRRGMREDDDVTHGHLREVYVSGIRSEEEAALTRGDRVDLTRFRTGHHPDIRRWRGMVGREEEVSCRLCGAAEESAAHLWLECEALMDLRRRHQLGQRMAELVEHPIRAMAMLRVILSRLR